MFRDSPVAVPYSFENTKFPTIKHKMRTLIKNHKEALAAHELAWTRMTECQKTTFTLFRKGNQVWLDSRNMKIIYHKKIAPKWERPFTITEVIGPVMYSWKITKKSNFHSFPTKITQNHLFWIVSTGQMTQNYQKYHSQYLQNTLETFLASVLQVHQKIHFHLFNVVAVNSTKTDLVILILGLNAIVIIHFWVLVFSFQFPIIIHNVLWLLSLLLWTGIMTLVYLTSAMPYELLVKFNESMVTFISFSFFILLYPFLISYNFNSAFIDL